MTATKLVQIIVDFLSSSTFVVYFFGHDSLGKLGIILSQIHFVDNSLLKSYFCTIVKKCEVIYAMGRIFLFLYFEAWTITILCEVTNKIYFCITLK